MSNYDESIRYMQLNASPLEHHRSVRIQNTIFYMLIGLVTVIFGLTALIVTEVAVVVHGVKKVKEINNEIAERDMLRKKRGWH